MLYDFSRYVLWYLHMLEDLENTIPQISQVYSLAIQLSLIKFNYFFLDLVWLTRIVARTERDPSPTNLNSKLLNVENLHARLCSLELHLVDIKHLCDPFSLPNKSSSQNMEIPAFHNHSTSAWPSSWRALITKASEGIVHILSSSIRTDQIRRFQSISNVVRIHCIHGQNSTTALEIFSVLRFKATAIKEGCAFMCLHLHHY